MKTCKFPSILTVSLILFQLFPLMIVIENAPIVPILTALATSAAGLFQIQVDTLHIAKYLRDAAQHKRHRGAFVRDLLYTAFYRSGQGYNVIVFNLAEEHRQRLHGVIFYGSVAFTDHTRFGIWVFEYGIFENQGARGWHNWGMIGSFKKSKDGNTIYFHKRHPMPLPNELEPSKNETDHKTKTKQTLQELLGIQEDPKQIVGDSNPFKSENTEIKNEIDQPKSSETKINIKIIDKRTKVNKS